MRKLQTVILLSMLLMSVFAVGVMESSRAAGVADTPWPMFHGDVRHTGLSQYDTSANQGSLKWKYRTGGDIYSSVAIGSDGSIYFGSSDYFFYALDSSGSQRWRHRTGDVIYSSPAVATDGTIYFGSEDHYLYALNPDGSQRWRFTTFGAIDSSPAIAPDGTIYVGSRDGKLYAINPDGTEKWEYDTGNDILFSSPAIAPDGTIYIGSYHTIYAFNPDGSLKWDYDAGSSVDYSSPTIGPDGTIYAAASKALLALNPDGSLKWEYDLTVDTFLTTPAIAPDGTIYVGSLLGELYAINPDGGLKWKYDANSAIYSSPVIGSDGSVFFGANNGYLYALNPDGTRRWMYGTGDDIRASPAIGADGSIYVGSYDNYLYVIGNERAPSPPRNLRIADSGPSYVNITWDPPLDDGGSRITSYKIYRGTSPGQESYYTYVNGDTLYFVDKDPIPGETNYYYVTALNAGGESDPSNEVSIPISTNTAPSPPQNLAVTVGKGYIELSWDPPADDGGAPVINYTVYRGTTSGGEVLLKVVSGSEYTYRDESVDAGITYYYYVTATNSVGESAPSNEVSASPLSSGTGGSSGGGDGTWIIILLLVLIIVILLALFFMKKGFGPQQSGEPPYQAPPQGPVQENVEGQGQEPAMPQPEEQPAGQEEQRL